MLRSFLAASVLLIVTTPSMAAFFSPGEPNGFDFNTPMTETFGGSGIWEYSWTGFVDADSTKFDILSVAGDWDSKVHDSGNQWVTPDGSDGNTIILDTNAAGDGWFPNTNRVKVASEDNANWTAVGDWQNQIGGGDWDNANVNTVMSDQGGGIFGFSAVLVPDSYQYKAVTTGTWDAIGGTSRNINSDNFGFTTFGSQTSVEMLVNTIDGTVRVNVTPEPSSILLIGAGAISLLALYRRRRVRA